MGGRDKQGFKLAAWKIDAPIQHRPKSFRKLCCVTATRGGPVGDWLAGEEEGHHAADPCELMWHVCTDCGVSYSTFQARTQTLKSIVWRIVSQGTEHRTTGRCGQRISTECARLKYFAGRQNVVHDLGPAAIRSHRQTATYDFAESREIRLDAEQLLRSAVGHTKAGHHLVADQKCVLFPRQSAK